jgi:hypothetical protein
MGTFCAGVGTTLATERLEAADWRRLSNSGNAEIHMAKATIQDWTDSNVLLKFDQHRDVKYRVYREEDKLFLEVRDLEDQHIHTLELPNGMKLERSSYEVLLRYVLLDVVAA